MTTVEYDYDARRLRMETLLMLRWVAITGQAAACIGVYFILGFDFPVGLCFVFITASATLNIGMRFGTPRSFRLGDVEAAVLLGYDIIQLGFLLYLTGGLTNSFAMLFLTPVIISAVSLPSNLTLLLGIVMIAVATVLTVEYYPLPWYADEKLTFPLLYRTGVWAALALSAVFIGMYAARVSDEARLLADALAATELVLEREQHLSQLDGLAAAAAHELGTPLATITLIIKELQNALPENAP
ncbi:MAG: two-component sensor histidine kinase, partial [Methylocystis sp.]